MGKVTGFLEIDRQVAKYQPASDRIRHFREFSIPMSDSEVSKQAARCMDCGIPFCHGPTGCPIHNQIPDWNDLVYNGNWEEAIRNLHSTNNFPEFTGRVCPAPCEEACTLNLEDIPVAIKTVEQALADKAYDMGYVVPKPCDTPTGKKIAVIGSGPAGMAAAQQLARAGHEVHVFERESRAGGLMRFGIPDFKMEKHFIDRRVEQMEGEGVNFHYNVNVGIDRTVDDLMRAHDAVLYCGGSEKPRDAGLPGADLVGVHDAMPYLVQQNKRVARENIEFDRLAVTAHPGGRQACRRRRRRRYGVRLHRHGLPSGCRQGHAARHPSAAAGKGRQAGGLALLGDQDAHLVIPGRGRRSRVSGRHPRIRRRGRGAHRRKMLSGR